MNTTVPKQEMNRKETKLHYRAYCPSQSRTWYPIHPHHPCPLLSLATHWAPPSLRDHVGALYEKSSADPFSNHQTKMSKVFRPCQVFRRLLASILFSRSHHQWETRESIEETKIAARKKSMVQKSSPLGLWSYRPLHLRLPFAIADLLESVDFLGDGMTPPAGFSFISAGRCGNLKFGPMSP